MTIASMTGFARAEGAHGSLRWVWEIKTVNGRGLDVRLRTPSGFDAVEAEARTRISARLVRGNCNATLSLTREASSAEIRVNEALLQSLVASLEPIRLRAGAAPLQIENLLSVRGVVETVEAEEAPEGRAAQEAVILAGLDEALDALVAARIAEGSALEQVLRGRLDEIHVFTNAIDNAPERRPDAIRQRLADQVAMLAETNATLDPQRLHQEALILAAKADVREELDRLHAHVKVARDLLAAGGAVGRRLDFLAQEFGRESNTLCSKSNHVSLTAKGLELKAIIEQFREQVQNIE